MMNHLRGTSIKKNQEGEISRKLAQTFIGLKSELIRFWWSTIVVTVPRCLSPSCEPPPPSKCMDGIPFPGKVEKPTDSRRQK